jgi:hypothetical protein
VNLQHTPPMPEDTNQAIVRLLSTVDRFPIDRSVIPQERLDLLNRYRTSLFPWRGQFSPELIELLLSTYTHEGSVVADPFVGSGTTLFESARRSLTSYGAEINPAAVVMASTAHFVSIPLAERKNLLQIAQSIVENNLPASRLEGLFSSLEEEGEEETLTSMPDAIKTMLYEASPNPLIYNLLANTVIRFTSLGKDGDSQTFLSAFRDHKIIVEELPYSKNPSQVFHCDARKLPLDPSSVDFIVTSPPYINVFNYHQNHRPAMELMGWDLLQVAKSEFGSNRKNRGNRFLTAVQYMVDMLQALLEMRRIIRPNGRIVIVVGRESSVRGVSLQNGRIVGVLAIGGANLRLDIRQERKFKTKFGETIYEDILHFVPCEQPSLVLGNLPYLLANQIFRDIVDRAEDDVRTDILDAMQQASKVEASPYFAISSSLRSGEKGEGRLATPHLDKLNAAIANPKSAGDIALLKEARDLYYQWVADLDALTSQGKQRVTAMVNLLNQYKDAIEVDFIMKRGSDFLRRQKGQLKLDNSIWQSTWTWRLKIAA